MGSIFSQKQKEDKATMTGNHKNENGTQATRNDIESLVVSEDLLALYEHPALQQFDKEIIKAIFHQIHKDKSDVTWESIGGLEEVKETLEQSIVFPMKRLKLRPDSQLYTKLRQPPTGVLLFGPPGNGKTMIGRCVASQCEATFFNIQPSSLLSKWWGESEQLVSALFKIAEVKAPSIIFFDEIDSLLSTRKDDEAQHIRSIKNTFLANMDGMKKLKGVFVIGATNKPREIDDAARGRFTRRIYVPLPSDSTRKHILKTCLNQHPNTLNTEGDKQWDELVLLTSGFSGRDLQHFCEETAMVPVTDFNKRARGVFLTVQVPPITLEDCKTALKKVKSTVNRTALDDFDRFNSEFGRSG